jgi:hypothetical protein
MAQKRKPDDGLDEASQLKPLVGKSSGKGKGTQLFQSNAVKAGAAGVIVLLLVVIIGWQLMSGGSETKPAKTAAVAVQPQTQPQEPAPSAPPPMPEMPAEQTSAASEAKEPPAEENAQATQASPQTQSPEVQTEVAQVEQPQRSGHGGAHGVVPQNAPGSENLADLPKLPDDLAQWGIGDFVRARMENSPKLLEAVAYLGEKPGGGAPVAQQLAELLKTPKSSDPTVTVPGSMPGLTEAVVEALAKNGSKPAQETLKQILNGKFTTDDDSRAVDAVLKALVQKPSDENVDMVLKVIVSPEEIRPSTAQGSVQPSTMRSNALELVRNNPSDVLTLKLAENLVQKGAEPNDPVMDLLLQDNPAFLNAQLRLYQSEDLTPDNKSKLEQYFLNRSSQAVAMMMGIPAAEGATQGAAWTVPQPGGREGRGAPQVNPGAAGTDDAAKAKVGDYERGAFLAKLFWNEPFAVLMSQHLADVRNFEKSAQDIVLASTLPLASVRTAMFKMLKKRAVDSPQPLETAGWSDKVLNDPALIVLMKLLPRSKTIKTAPIAGASSASPAPGRGGRYPSARRPAGADVAGGTPSTGAEAAQKKAQIETEWLASLAKMVDAWCNRFDSAGQAMKRSIRRGQKVAEQPPTKVDEFEIPQDAKNLKDVKIISAYQLNWPDKAPGDLGKVKLAGLKVQFFRLQMTGMLKKTMTSFKTLAKGGDIHDLSNGQWLELTKNGSQPNTKRSLDIVVTSADKQTVDLSVQKEEPIDLQVDILAVEIGDPGSTGKD